MVYQSYGNSLTITNQPLPEAYVAQGKNRLKQNGSNVYLNNGDNFEIELFNPRTFSVLVKIKLNGSYIPGGGLVLRPGQRYWLDRYLDVARKFVFNTYEIASGDVAAQVAAAQNGLVQIEFYDEQGSNPLTVTNTGGFTYTAGNGGYGGIVNPTITIGGGYPNNIVFGSTTAGNPNSGTITTNSLNVGHTTSDNVTLDGMFGDNVQCSYTSNMGTSPLRSFTNTKGLGDYKDQLFKAKLSKQSLSMETGRIEKGGKSDQTFGEVDMNFNSYTSVVHTWYIKPKSTEPVQTKNLAPFCTECGKKLKEGFKFCPSCGTKVTA
jgi:hypothetical protein